MDFVRLLIEWVAILTAIAALYWLGPEPIPQLARAHSRFPWVQPKKNVYRLDAPGMEIFGEYHELEESNRFWVSKRLDGKPLKDSLHFDAASDAFSFADHFVPEEAEKALEGKARWRG